MLVAPGAHAQPADVQSLREQVAALQAQLAELTARLDQVENQTADTAVTVATIEQAANSASPSAVDNGITIKFAGAPEIEGQGGWSFKPFGRIQADAGFTSLPDGLAADDGFGSELRRVRLGMAGDIPGGFGYKVEVDFAGSDAELTDAYLSYGHDGFTATAGQHNTFQSLEELTSSRFSSFIERAAFTDAFGFERRLGVSGQYVAGDLLVQAGAFSDNIEDLPGKSWSLDGRVVFAPKMGSTQLHLGGSLHHADLAAGDTVRYRQRPLVHFTSTRAIDTGNLAAESELGAGLEAALIAGPLHAAGEAYWQRLDRPGALVDPTFFGGYAEVGYFLTGESRGYKSFKFDRTRATREVGEGGIGAIQVNLRYDYLDLNDRGIAGGTQNGYLASLVWVPTDYTRLMLNYGHLEYDSAALALPGPDRSYGADVVGMRAQVDF